MSETVGIVGGGPAGLAAAYMLSQNPKFKVYIFDKNVQMGMDSQSITLEFPQQGLPFIAANAGAATASQHRIDVPLRSFSPGYYPCLAKMYKHCGIQAQPTAHSITFSVHGPTLESVSPMVSYTTISILGYEVIIPDQHLDLAVQARLMADFTRFMFISAYHYDTNTLGKFSSINIRQYLSQTGYGIEFQDYLLIPFLVTVATCSTKSAREYPASVVLDFMARNHSVHRVTNGIKHVCELLTRKVYKIENDSQVTAVYKKKSAAGTGDVVVEYIRGKQLQKENFDHVIIAAEACHTVKMLQGHSSAHRQRIDALSSFHYEKTHVVTHMDTRFLPRDKNVWRTVNVSTLAGSELKSMGTVLFNKMADMPQSPPILQTSSHSHMPLPELTLASSSFDRAVCRLSSLSAIDALDMCQGMDNIYTIGSYAYPGVPLLEGAVCSAMKACHSIGYTCPWFYSDPTNRQTIYGPDSSRKRGVLVETYFQSGGRPSLLKRPAYMLVSLVSSVPLLAEVCIKLWLWFCYCLVFFQMLVNPFSKALGRLFAKSKND